MGKLDANQVKTDWDWELCPNFSLRPTDRFVDQIMWMHALRSIGNTS